MDNQRHYDHQQQANPQGLDEFGNPGYPSQQYDNYFHDQSLNNGFDPSWTYAHPGATTAQHLPDYGTWQTPGLQSNSLADASGQFYAQRPTASPIAHTATPSQFQNFPDPHNGQRHHAFDPSLSTQGGQSSHQYYAPSNAYLQPPRRQSISNIQNQTVAPSAIETIPQSQGLLSQRVQTTQSLVDQLALSKAVPAGKETGLFGIVDENTLSKSTASKRMGSFVNISQQDYEYPINKSVIPAAPSRKSRKQLRKLAADDPKLLAKLGKTGRKTTSVNRAARIAKAVSSVASSRLPKAENGNVSLSEDSTSDEDSSDYSSDDEPDLPNPLPPKRPEDDPKAAVRYDTLKALWRARRSHLPLSEIRSGLKDFWEVVRTIRDRWKTDAAAVKAAEEKNKVGELPLLKSRVRDQREMIEAAFSAALEHGNREILEVSSENASFLFLCYQFLQDRFVQGDVDGVLSRAILEILAMCVTLNEEKLTKTHLVKVLPRYTKKGNPETQALVTKINTSSKEASQKVDEQTPKIELDKKPAALAADSPPVATKTPATGTKRPAPGSSTTAGPAKRVAGVAPAATAAAAKPATAGIKRPLSAAAGNKATASAAAPAVKTKTAVSKPSAFFNAMQSTAKKPTPAAKPAVSSVVAAAIKSVEKTPAAAAAAETPAKAGFSFADTMASLHKPKEKAPTPKPQADIPNETPEQRKKRLRKEARRGLRVVFKPDSDLVEIRLFTHHPEEEYGHDTNMTRDAGDLSGEGRMFKQHKDQMDLDDEDDGPGEEDLLPYRTPGLVDFTEIDPEERDRSFVPFGGGSLQPESPEKILREQHEANTLIVFYADRSDIPPTPKEPSEETEEPNEPGMKDFGAPQGVFVERLAKAKKPAPSQPVQSVQAQSAAPPDLTALLAALNPQTQQTPTPFQPPPSGAPLANLQSLLAQFGNTQAAAAQPLPQTAAAPVNVANLIASLQATPQQPQFQQNQAPNATPDLSAILAVFQQNSGAAPAPNPALFPPGFPVPGGFAPPAAPFGQQQGYAHENEERRRWREGGGEVQQMQQMQQMPQMQNTGQRGFENKHFTQPCKYWPMGRCQKGDKCTYRHE